MRKLILLTLLLSSCGSIAVQGGSSHYLGLEAELAGKIRPIVGVAQIRGDNEMVYGGASYEDTLLKAMDFRVTVGAGRYDADSLSLGGSFQFRSSIELFLTRHISVGAVHVSNASLGRFNPGFDAVFIGLRF